MCIGCDFLCIEDWISLAEDHLHALVALRKQIDKELARVLNSCGCKQMLDLFWHPFDWKWHINFNLAEYQFERGRKKIPGGLFWRLWASTRPKSGKRSPIRSSRESFTRIFGLKMHFVSFLRQKFVYRSLVKEHLLWQSRMRVKQEIFRTGLIALAFGWFLRPKESSWPSAASKLSLELCFGTPGCFHSRK